MGIGPAENGKDPTMGTKTITLSTRTAIEFDAPNSISVTAAAFDALNKAGLLRTVSVEVTNNGVWYTRCYDEHDTNPPMKRCWLIEIGPAETQRAGGPK